MTTVPPMNHVRTPAMLGPRTVNRADGSVLVLVDTGPNSALPVLLASGKPLLAGAA